MIRTAWFALVLFFSSALHASGVIVAALVGVKRRPGGVYDWGTNDWSRDLLRAAGTPVRVVGLERVPAGPVVYASNHSSMFDIWALAATLPGSVRFVAKQELARIPLLGRAMITAGHIMIDRAHPARAVEAYQRAAAIQERAVRAGDRGAGPHRACLRARHVHHHAQGTVFPAAPPDPHRDRRTDLHGRADARAAPGAARPRARRGGSAQGAR